VKQLTAVSWGEGRIDLFWIGSDGAVWHRAWSADDGWSADERLGGRPASNLAVVSWAGNEIQLFTVFDDGQLWNIYWDGGAWHHWVEMGGELDAAGSVAASTWGAQRIDVFATGRDGALWHRWWNGREWIPWQREDGIGAS
jgi:hypothetical protein